MLLGSPSGCLPGTLQRGTITWLFMKIKCFHSPVSQSDYNVSVVLVGSKFNGQLFPRWETGPGDTSISPPLLIKVEEMEISLNGRKMQIPSYYLLIADRACPKYQTRNIQIIDIWWKEYWNNFVRLLLSSVSVNQLKFSLPLEKTKLCFVTCYGRFVIGVKS